MGRFWQIYLTIGLMLWVGLVVRALRPVFQEKRQIAGIPRSGIGRLDRPAVCRRIDVGRKPHSLCEYWRWWVVHLWVEGVFEVFATAIISLLFVRMGILRTSTATVMVLFATIIFLFGGVLGTFHHLYFSGTPISVIAVGAWYRPWRSCPSGGGLRGLYAPKSKTSGVGSQLPLAIHVLCRSAVLEPGRRRSVRIPDQSADRAVLHAGFEHDRQPWPCRFIRRLRNAWPGLDALLSAWLNGRALWNQKALRISFWCLNIGLAMMTFLSLLPQGMFRRMRVKPKLRLARSAEFMHSPIMQAFVWMRVPGDIVFSVGVGAFAWFMYRAFADSWATARLGGSITLTTPKATPAE